MTEPTDYYVTEAVHNTFAMCDFTTCTSSSVTESVVTTLAGSIALVCVMVAGITGARSDHLYILEKPTAENSSQRILRQPGHRILRLRYVSSISKY